MAAVAEEDVMKRAPILEDRGPKRQSMERRLYGITDTSEMFGISRRLVKMWVYQDVVRPRGLMTTGKGFANYLTVENLVEVKICHQLYMLGVPAHRAAEVLGVLHLSDYFGKLRASDRSREPQALILRVSGDKTEVTVEQKFDFAQMASERCYGVVSLVHLEADVRDAVRKRDERE